MVPGGDAMGRRVTRQSRLALKKETLRRLSDVTLAGVVGGINTMGSLECAGTLLCDAPTGVEADRQGRTTSKHCLSGDN
jgi:hypothetical protein